MTDLIKIVVLIFLLLLPESVMAQERRGFGHPERVGVGLKIGSSYDPSPTFDFYQLAWVMLYDYDRVWPQRAPEQLFFKLEGSFGMTDFAGETRLMTSANIFAQYYLTAGSGQLRTYVEAGIGLCYS